jgi:acyl-coenzyme A synthetase/AMP-(fatty) acid ligase
MKIGLEYTDRVALTDEYRSLTYKDLHHEMRMNKVRMVQAGIQPTQRVLYYCEDVTTLDDVVWFLSICDYASVVALHRGLSDIEIKSRVRQSPVSAIIKDDKIVLTGDDAPLAQSGEVSIVYSSGTVQQDPKAIPVSMMNDKDNPGWCFHNGVFQRKLTMGKTPPRMINYGSLSVSYIQSTIFETLLNSGTLYVLTDMKKWTEVANEFKPNITATFPMQYEDIMIKNQPLNYELDVVEWCGGAFNKSTFRKLKKFFKFKNFVNTYGTAETGYMTINITNDINEAESIGTPIDFDNFDIRLALDNEIIIKANSSGNEWYHTGDVVEVIDDKWYYSGRKDDRLIINKGVKIYPGEVELIASEIPGVDLAFCYNIPLSKVEGQPGLVYRGTIEPHELNKMLKEKISNYKRPVRISRLNDKFFEKKMKLSRTKLHKVLTKGDIIDEYSF